MIVPPQMRNFVWSNDQLQPVFCSFVPPNNMSILKSNHVFLQLYTHPKIFLSKVQPYDSAYIPNSKLLALSSYNMFVLYLLHLVHLKTQGRTYPHPPLVLRTLLLA